MPADDAVLCIDANKYLDLYRTATGKKLLASLQEQADHIFVTKQVVEEVQRNKPKEAATFLAKQFGKLRLQTFAVPDHGRLTIDNAPAEQAIRPPAVGRRNWLQIAGDGGLRSAAVLLRVAASAKRHGVNPWAYMRYLLIVSAARKRNSDWSDLLPDVWTQAQTRPAPAAP
jgi:hypothetical protein